MASRSLVELPRGAEPPFTVFVNGVRQAEGSDYRVKGRTLLFSRELAQEGRLGFWRWTLMFFSIAGTYRPHDSVDVKYRRDGREQVATNVEVVTFEEPGPPDASEAGERRGACSALWSLIYPAMRIDQIIEERRPCFSFEFFPPKDEEGMERLFNTVSELQEDDPAFVSVTYGAAGSTRDRTLGVVKRIRQETDIEAMAHFSVVGATVDELRTTLDDMEEIGIENVLALRGDPPGGETEWRATEGGLHYSTELARLISDRYPFCIGAACFPEVHPEAPSMEHDLRFLHEKIDAGASFLITQLFFDNELYFNFVDQARAAGIGVPIIPGIMPVTNYRQIKRFTEMCGASIPEDLERELAERQDDPDAVKDLGVSYATLQCAELLSRGAPGIHFYTLNKSPATRSILAALRAARPWDRTLAPVGAQAS